VLQSVAAILRKLDARFPGWQLVQLGALPLDKFAKKTRNGACGIAGVRFAELAYLAHCYIVKPKAIASILPFLNAGATADGALTRFQGRNLARCHAVDHLTVFL